MTSDGTSLRLFDRNQPWGRRYRRLAHAGRRLERGVFGDRWGLFVFLLALVVSGLIWRVGIFITDSYTVGNAFVALTEGHLDVRRIVYGESLATPGMHVVDGQLYGRNYGQLFLSLPAYWLLSGLSMLVDPRVLLAALWSLSVLGLGSVLGSLVQRGRMFTVAGSLLATGSFLANVAIATDFDTVYLPFAALQLTGIIAGGLVGVVLYRLCRRLQTARVGVAAGILGVLGTPVLLWAPIPKRHVFTTLFPLAAVTTLALSRAGGPSPKRSDARKRWTHALAYGFVGATAWIHAAEGLLLFLVLLFTDLLTGETAWRPGRTTAAILLVLGLSLVPLAATNAAISGDPFEPPRELPNYHGQELVNTDPSADAGGSSGPGDAPDGDRPAGSTDDGPPVSPDSLFPDVVGLVVGAGAAVSATLQSAFDSLERLGSELFEGMMTAVTEPVRVYQTFLRSGYLAGVAGEDGTAAISLTVLESMPLLGGLLALPVAATQRFLNRTSSFTSWLRRPAGTADIGLAAYAIALTLLYLPRLPLHAQLTVRYLLPVFPIGLYFCLRSPSIRRPIEAHAPSLWWGYTAGLFIGGQILVIAVVSLTSTFGEAVQLHALIALGLAGALAVTAVSSAVFEDSTVDRSLAVILGLTAATTTAFVVLVSIGYTDAIGTYPNGGDHTVPFVRLLADAVTLA